MGDGVLAADPLFAGAADLHLRSKGGRWDPDAGDWVRDGQNSPCIDAGDPADPTGDEPFPHGRRINLGAYGGTAEASRSVLRGTLLYLR